MAKETPQKKPSLLVRLLAGAVTAALMLGALFLVLHRDAYNLDALKSWLALRSVSADETGTGAAFPYAGGGKQSAALLEGGILFSSDSGAHYYSLSGQLYDEAVTPFENPVLSASERAGVVYDAGGQQLYLYRGGTTAFSLTLPGDGDLLSARCSDSGWLAVTAQTSGYKGTVTVYDEQGEKVIAINLSSTFAVDAAVAPDKKSVAVVTMDQEGGAFRSRLLLYPMDGEQPYAQLSLAGETVLALEYEQEHIWILTDSGVHIISADGTQEQVYSFGRSYLKGFSLDGQGFALLLLGRYRAGSATQAVTVDTQGNVLAQLELHEQVLSYDAAGSSFALLTADELAVHDKSGQALHTLHDTQSARYTALSADGFALLASQEKAWLYLPG